MNVFNEGFDTIIENMFKRITKELGNKTSSLRKNYASEKKETNDKQWYIECFALCLEDGDLKKALDYWDYLKKHHSEEGGMPPRETTRKAAR